MDRDGSNARDEFPYIWNSSMSVLCTHLQRESCSNSTFCYLLWRCLQALNGDSSSITSECRALLQSPGFLWFLTDPLFEVPQNRKSNGQNENKPEPKEMKQITATLDNLAKLAFTSVPTAPWRALSGDYCSHRLCFLTQIRPTYTPFGDLSTISPVCGIIHGSIALHCTFWHSVVIPELLLLDNCKLIVSASKLLFKNLFWLFYFICMEFITCFQKGRKISRTVFSLKAHL